MAPDEQLVPSAHPSPRLALWVVSAVLLASVAVLGSLVYHRNQPLPIDNSAAAVFRGPLVSRFLERLQLSPEGPPSRVVYLARSVLLLVGGVMYLGLIAASWRAGDRRAAGICVLGPLVAFVLTEELLKPVIHRRKGLSDALAFPSGHASVAAAIAASAIVVALRRRGWRWALLCAPVAALLPVGMGLAVVRLGYHYPTDVAGGTAFGLAVVFALAAALPGQRRSIAKPSRYG